jgi:glucose/arabinose dehydrogenase
MQLFAPILIAALWMVPGRAVADLPGVTVDPVVRVAEPLYVGHAGDERIFVAERSGRILIYTRADGLNAVPFLDIHEQVNGRGEGGLLSFAFHPDYAQNGYFYVHYTRTATPLNSVVARYSVSAGDPDVADPNSAAVLLDIPQPFDNHNGGQLQFGPHDGYLYASFGDGGSGGDPACNAQRNDNLLGTLLRLDVDQNVDAPPYYGIPPDNPFGGAGEPPAEVWATGLRNPWRFSFDRANGDLYVGDVGQGSWEEIDRHTAASGGGVNYGWKVMEGRACFDPDPLDLDCPAQTPSCFDPAFTEPVFVYANTGFGGNCAVTGGLVYRGREIPQLAGAYVFGDYCSGQIWALEAVGSDWQRTEVLNVGFGLTSFGEDTNGELYMTVDDDVLRLSSPLQTKAQRQCSDALWAGFRSVERVAARDAKICLRDGARGRLPGTVEVCTTTDRKGHIQRAEQKTIQRAARRCAVPPEVGPFDPVAVNATAASAPRDLLHDVLGPDLDASLADAGSAPGLWKCQEAVVRALQSCTAVRLKQFARCAKQALADDRPDTEQLLEACMDDDPRGVVERACDAALGRIASRVLPRTCVKRGADLSDAFPGCASDDPIAVATCLERNCNATATCSTTSRPTPAVRSRVARALRSNCRSAPANVIGVTDFAPAWSILPSSRSAAMWRQRRATRREGLRRLARFSEWQQGTGSVKSVRLISCGERDSAHEGARCVCMRGSGATRRSGR